MPAARPTEALIHRALKAWQACDLPVGGVHVYPDGSIRILAPDQVDDIPSGKSGDSDGWDEATSR